MSHPRARVTPGWDFAKGEEAALGLEQLLRRYDIDILPESLFKKHILEVLRLVGYRQSGTGELLEADSRAVFRTLIGVHELATLVLASESSPSFCALIPHLRLLNEGSALQNLPSGGRDQATNKLFELFVATLAIHCGTDVELDDPAASAGNNPDVLVTIGGRRWGLACKVLHGLHPEGIIQNLEKGIDQIERSPAEIGAVVFNLKNVLPHEQIWPLADIETSRPASGAPNQGPGSWDDPRTPYDLLMNWLAGTRETLLSHLPADYLGTIFERKKSFPGFLLWAHSVSGVRIDERPTVASLRVLNVANVAEVPPHVRSAIGCLNWAAFTGSPDRGPRPCA